MDRSFSACEIAEIAIQMELNGKAFYELLAGKASGEDVAEVFRGLAREETEHEKFFRGLADGSCSYDPEGAYPEEYFSYMRSLSSNLFVSDAKEARRIAGEVSSCEEGIDIGIRMEKDSILFYLELGRSLPEEVRPMLEKVIEQEKGHLTKLCSMKGDENGKCESV